MYIKTSCLLKKLNVNPKLLPLPAGLPGPQPLASAAGRCSSHLARRTPSTGDVLQSFWYKVPSSAVTENLKGRKLKQLSATWAMCAGHGGLARGQVGRENFPNPKC